MGLIDELQRCKDVDDSMNWLHRSARSGDVEKMKILLKRHPDLQQNKACDGTIPLYWAVTCGNLTGIQLLVSAGSDVFCRSQKGDTLLTVAVICGHVHLVLYLVGACGIDPDMTGSESKSPVHRAIENDSLEMVSVLVTIGAEIDNSCFPIIARYGNISILKYVINKFQIDVNFQDWKGKAALMYTAEHCHMLMLKMLLEIGADIMAKDKKHRTSLHYAVEGGSKEILEYLIQRATKHTCLTEYLNSKDKYLGSDRCFFVRGKDNGLLAFHYIDVDRFLMDIFREITRSGGSLDVAKYGKVIKSGWGSCPAPEVVKEIDAMYDISCITPDTPHDLTPLSLAIIKDKQECALFLLECGADVTKTDTFGLTPLHLACMRGSLDVVDALVKHGAKIDVEDIHGRNALQSAKANRHTKVINFLTSLDFNQQYASSLQVTSS